MELMAYAPLAKRKQEKYRAPMFNVVQEMMNPTMAAPMQTVMCQVLSFKRPDDRPARYPTMPETRYGGHVKTRVIVLLNPRAPMTVGKKLLNEQADRCMF
jgi:hypothetical protein